MRLIPQISITLAVIPLLWLANTCPAMDIHASRNLTTALGDSIEAKIVMVEEHHVTFIRVADNQEFKVRPEMFSNADQAYFQKWKASKSSFDKQGRTRPKHWDERLVPGYSFSIEFDNLEPTLSGKPAHARIRLPDQYVYNKRFPMLVWLNPGNGGTVLPAKLAPSEKFITVSLPYPESTDRPRIAMMRGEVDKIGKYHKEMIKEVFDLIPNIDDRLVVCAGFSSGAHITACGGSRNWKWFEKTFTCLIMIEGACTAPKSLKGFKNKYVYSAYGSESPFDATPVFNRQIQSHNPKLFTERIMPGVAHEFPHKEQLVARKWLTEKVMPACLSE
jgi:predicted esterase